MAEAPLPVPNQLKAQLQKCKTVRNANVRTTKEVATALIKSATLCAKDQFQRERTNGINGQ
jgi:hypothetical protein